MTDFHGLPVRAIGNDHLRLECLAESGPRLVRLFLAGSTDNVLAETPDVQWPTPWGKYSLRGGHRLAIAPEALGVSYAPDDDGVTVEELSDGVRLLGPLESPAGVSKTIEIHLHPDRPALTLRHVLQNQRVEAVSIAPWAVTQLPTGGSAVLPLRHAPERCREAPDRQVVLWPYASWRDERLVIDDEYARIDARPSSAELKIGALTPGWLGYLDRGVFFLKRFDPQLDQPHPDLNTNAQVYCHDRCVELESLAPLMRLEPGQISAHLETWEIYRAGDAPISSDGLRAWLPGLQLV